MSDARLRELERSGDRVAWLAAARRAGIVTSYAQPLGPTPRPRPTDCRGEDHRWMIRDEEEVPPQLHPVRREAAQLSAQIPGVAVLYATCARCMSWRVEVSASWHGGAGMGPGRVGQALTVTGEAMAMLPPHAHERAAAGLVSAVRQRAATADWS